MWRTRIPHTIPVGMWVVQPLWKAVWWCPQACIPYNPGILHTKRDQCLCTPQNVPNTLLHHINKIRNNLQVLQQEDKCIVKYIAIKECGQQLKQKQSQKEPLLPRTRGISQSQYWVKHAGHKTEPNDGLGSHDNPTQWSLRGWSQNSGWYGPKKHRATLLALGPLGALFGHKHWKWGFFFLLKICTYLLHATCSSLRKIRRQKSLNSFLTGSQLKFKYWPLMLSESLPMSQDIPYLTSWRWLTFLC